VSLLDNDRFREYLGRRILCEVETDEKLVALTFDDGPSLRNTPAILDMLERKDIRATFFVVGRRVRRFPEIVRRAADAGHEIANHTWRHVGLTLLPPMAIRRSVLRTSNVVERVAGVTPRFVRPPMGWFNDAVLRSIRATGLTPVIGSIHPQDSRKPGTDVIVERVLRRISPGAVIILHDGGWRLQSDRSQSVAAVDEITDVLLSKGYRFETLSRLVEAGGASVV
jgi:peptidoglycan/xylan/chitin deacetylase (PgdA/CDA1 family)